MLSSSTTLIVKGTRASEFRTRFCPMRLTYSLITGSWFSFTLASICWAYSLPMRISLSSEYKSPRLLPLPIFRLPIDWTSSLLPGLMSLSFLSLSGSGAAFASFVGSAPGGCGVSWLSCDCASGVCPAGCCVAGVWDGVCALGVCDGCCVVGVCAAGCCELCCCESGVLAGACVDCATANVAHNSARVAITTRNFMVLLPCQERRPAGRRYRHCCGLLLQLYPR